MNVESITINGKEYIPIPEYNYRSCLGCSFYKGACNANKLCKSIGNRLILIEKGGNKPCLTDYRTINSYEDACVVLEMKPMYDILPFPGMNALIKLETISWAIKGRVPRKIREVQRDNNNYYYPCFEIFTEEKIKDVLSIQKQSAIHIVTNDGRRAYFSLRGIQKIKPNVYFNQCLELYQLTEEKAYYLGGRNFIHLWAEYFGFDYVEGDYYIDNINE